MEFELDEHHLDDIREQLKKKAWNVHENQINHWRYELDNQGQLNSVQFQLDPNDIYRRCFVAIDDWERIKHRAWILDSQTGHVVCAQTGEQLAAFLHPYDPKTECLVFRLGKLYLQTEDISHRALTKNELKARTKLQTQTKRAKLDTAASSHSLRYYFHSQSSLPF